MRKGPTCPDVVLDPITGEATPDVIAAVTQYWKTLFNEPFSAQGLDAATAAEHTQFVQEVLASVPAHEAHDILDAPFTVEEVVRALDDMKFGKQPGLDGTHVWMLKHGGKL